MWINFRDSWLPGVDRTGRDMGLFLVPNVLGCVKFVDVISDDS